MSVNVNCQQTLVLGEKRHITILLADKNQTSRESGIIFIHLFAIIFESFFLKRHHNEKNTYSNST